jgi:hypothetical protein
MNCLGYAFEVYERRAREDTNPFIAQVVGLNGRLEGHWYYRSDQVVATSKWPWKREDGGINLMNNFEGHVSILPKRMQRHFSGDRWRKDGTETYLAEHGGQTMIEKFREMMGSFKRCPKKTSSFTQGKIQYFFVHPFPAH